MKKIFASLVLFFASASAFAATFSLNDNNPLEFDTPYSFANTSIPAGNFSDLWLFTVSADSSLETFVQSIQITRGGGLKLTNFDVLENNAVIALGTFANNSLTPSMTQYTMSNVVPTLLPGMQYALQISGIAQGSRIQDNQVRSYGGLLLVADNNPGTGEIITSPVPEAEGWSMMLLGLGVISAVAKRRAR